MPIQKKHFKLLPAIIVATIGISLAYLMSRNAGDDEPMPELHVQSGAGLIKPMQELLSAFEARHRVKIVTHYGGSGELMGQLAMNQASDVFIPGADKYVGDAQKKGWIADGTVRDIVKHVPVIATSRENPKQIRILEDLAKPGMVVAIGDRVGCAIGRVAEAILKKNGLYDRVKPNIEVRTPTVNQLLLYVTLGKVDAAIIWEDMASWSESAGKLMVVGIPDEQNIIKTISAAVTTRSKNSGLAKTLVDFLGSGTGLGVWKKWGFEPCPK